MSDSILIIGTRAIAATLGIGRNRLLGWLNDPEIGLPVSNKLMPGRWVATRQNLIEWSNDYFSARPAFIDKPYKTMVSKQPEL